MSPEVGHTPWLTFELKTSSHLFIWATSRTFEGHIVVSFRWALKSFQEMHVFEGITGENGSQTCLEPLVLQDGIAQDFNTYSI